MRKYLIAGNWKMNFGPAKTTDFFKQLKQERPEIPEGVDVLICPPYISLPAAAEAAARWNTMKIGAQDVHYEDNGAFTGEISTSMLNEIACSYVIIGHSERREYFGETDKTVNQKVSKSLEAGIMPVICVGESLDQRKKGKHVTLVTKQVVAALNGVAKNAAAGIVIAYEPIWAIGTGETATPGQAQEMHETIRNTVGELFDAETAGNMRILYGGSMKPHNAGELLGRPDVDGGLIGGASLKAESFSEIIGIADKLS